MGKALVVYASRTGQTKRIAELIAEGIRMAGQEAELVDASRIREPSQLEGFDAYVFGSATYHGEMLPSMKQLLFMAEKAGLKGKVGGSFGAFGWSGEAPERIYQTMKNVFGMEMVGDSLRLKSAALEGGVQMAQGYGRDVGAKLAS
jgi:flavorubredoxin